MPLEGFNYKQDYLLVICPWCNVQGRATPVTRGIYRPGMASQDELYVILECPSHKCRPFLAVGKLGVEPVTETYPYPKSRPDQFDESIPPPIREDYAEARRCWHGQCYRATVVMCRRTMQAIARQKGAKGDKLHQQIDDLKTQGLITASLHEAATEVRHFGNFGAHPDDDLLADVTREDAEAILGLTDAFLEDLYIRPDQTSQLRKKRTESQ